jgi:hypothetical protein
MEPSTGITEDWATAKGRIFNFFEQGDVHIIALRACVRESCNYQFWSKWSGNEWCQLPAPAPAPVKLSSSAGHWTEKDTTALKPEG